MIVEGRSPQRFIINRHGVQSNDQSYLPFVSQQQLVMVKLQDDIWNSHRTPGIRCRISSSAWTSSNVEDEVREEPKCQRSTFTFYQKMYVEVNT